MEEIIIDGVNVAECIHLSIIEKECCCNNQYEKYATCKNYNCYYKQLQRLKQENELAKQFINGILKRFEIENYDWQEDQNKIMAEIDNKNNALLDEVEDDLVEYYSKYRYALEEIREITEQDRNCMNSEVDCCRLCEKLDLIQNKINEVLGW